MPTLPHSLAPIWAAVASILLSPEHAQKLYGADDVAAALNIAADAFNGARVDTTMLLRAFANEAVGEFRLNYVIHF